MAGTEDTLLVYHGPRTGISSAAGADHGEQVRWLRQVGERFGAAAGRLFELMEQAVAAKPPSMSDHQFALLQQIGAAAASGVSLDAALGGDD